MSLRVLLIEPYYGGSHRAWADGFRAFSSHDISLLTLPASFWKWRMQGGAVTLARLYNDTSGDPDAILASDMFDLAAFRALTRRRTASIPAALYFHENQLTYPQNARQRHGWRYGFTNYVSALAAERVYFNSAFHRAAFFAALPKMLKHFADYNELESVTALEQRAEVLPLGLDLRRYDAHRSAPDSGAPPLIVWNHRWEADKNPAAFFAALDALAEQDVPFRVALLGENFAAQPAAFEAARQRLGARVIQYGYMPDFGAYARLLWAADYVVSTAYQDFFGAAVVEAMYCGCVPLLPDRLNYPALLPESQRAACLYPRDRLLPLLLRHLRGQVSADRAALRASAARFDWARLAPQYDAALSRLAAGT